MHSRSEDGSYDSEQRHDAENCRNSHINGTFSNFKEEIKRNNLLDCVPHSFQPVTSNKNSHTIVKVNVLFVGKRMLVRNG